MKFGFLAGILGAVFIGGVAAEAGEWGEGARMDEGRVLAEAATSGTDIYVRRRLCLLRSQTFF